MGNPEFFVWNRDCFSENACDFILFVKITEKWLTSVQKYGILYKDDARLCGKESEKMKVYTAPTGELLAVDAESILATADSGIRNAGDDTDSRFGKLILIWL